MSDKSWASHGARKAIRVNRGRDTKPELALRRALHALALRYFVGRQPVPSLRRTEDLASRVFAWLSSSAVASGMDVGSTTPLPGCGTGLPSLHCWRLGWQILSGK